MNVPNVTEPHKYRGLYVFDFGEWTSVGYTAEEIAMLLESEAYQDGKVYKIVRATPDGQMELKGVPRTRFDGESGMLFNRASQEAAQADFDTLCALGAAGAPCRAFVHLADRGAREGVARYVTALIYPGEYEEDIAHWLLEAGYQGGDTVEGGPSHVTDYYGQDATLLARQQLVSHAARTARAVEEVFASVRRAVQR